VSLADNSVDALIIGGGPAGLAAALALHYAGFRTMVVDSRRPPLDKTCGEGLMPDALLSLARLGVQVDPADGAEFTGIRFCDDASSVEAKFPNGVGIGVKRTRLHHLMLTHAKRVGVSLVWDAKVQLGVDGNVFVNNRRISYRWLVGADGQSSSVRRWAGLEQARSLEARYGFRKHYLLHPWTDRVEVHWGSRGQFYVTPIGADQVCVALVTRDPRVRIDDVLPECRELQDRLRDATSVAPERGAVTTTRKLVRVAQGSVILVGDASGSVDAVTGEGMAMSFRQAVALADALGKSDLRSYQSTHDAIGKLPSAMAGLLLLMDRYPSVRKRALQVMAASPQDFGRLLSVHVGHESLSHFALTTAPAFGWRLLTTPAVASVPSATILRS